jgi:hypothetical protein
VARDGRVGQAGAGTVQAAASRRGLQPDGDGDLRGSESLPVRQRQQLAILARQRGEGGRDGAGQVVLAHERRRGEVGGEALGEAVAPAPPAALVGEDAPCDAQQPGQRVGRHRVEPAPGDEERLGDDVGRVGGVGRARSA